MKPQDVIEQAKREYGFTEVEVAEMLAEENDPPVPQTCRIEVNRFDGRGWRQWGCGREFDTALADKLIDFMRPDPQRRMLEAAGLAVPGKLFRKVPGRNEAISEEVA